jgi:hypothetical protein
MTVVLARRQLSESARIRVTACLNPVYEVAADHDGVSSESWYTEYA